jgi:hypothetical protein
MHFIHATSGGRESKLQKRNMDMIILVTSKCRERERERERESESHGTRWLSVG